MSKLTLPAVMQASRYWGPEILTLGRDRNIARGSTGNTVGRFIFIDWLAAGAGVGDALAVADSLLPAPALLLGEAVALGAGLEVADGIIESSAVTV